MSYEDKSFWEQYEEYIEESLPRHRRAVNMLLHDKFPHNGVLLDLGCGQCMEAADLIEPLQYIGVDQNPPSKWILEGTERKVHKLDYRKDSLDRVCISEYHVDFFSSFFSSEVTETYPQNERLYEKIFQSFPSLQWGLVSGFYYRGRRNEAKVEETGGIVSYQSIWDLADVESEVFEETRLLVKAPSKMFGPDVIEVWKLLERK